MGVNLKSINNHDSLIILHLAFTYAHQALIQRGMKGKTKEKGSLLSRGVV